jgi:23S rRNA pseudouridine2605 synthase
MNNDLDKKTELTTDVVVGDPSTAAQEVVKPKRRKRTTSASPEIEGVASDAAAEVLSSSPPPSPKKRNTEKNSGKNNEKSSESIKALPLTEEVVQPLNSPPPTAIPPINKPSHKAPSLGHFSLGEPENAVPAFPLNQPFNSVENNSSFSESINSTANQVGQYNQEKRLSSKKTETRHLRAGKRLQKKSNYSGAPVGTHSDNGFIPETNFSFSDSSELPGVSLSASLAEGLFPLHGEGDNDERSISTLSAISNFVNSNKDIDTAIDTGIMGSDIGVDSKVNVGDIFNNASAGSNEEVENNNLLKISFNAQEINAQAEERFADVAEGGFDIESNSSENDQFSIEKRVLMPQIDAPKLQKVLAQAGISSRRDIEQMIQSGRIAVNGNVAHVGQRVMSGDRVEIDGQPIRLRITPPSIRILVYHKPVGEVVTFYDPENRPTVFKKLPRLGHGKWQSVGRLDINTEGLLLFSTSGDLANQLMHPRFGVEREYAVRVLGSLDAEKRARLLQGIHIDGHEASFLNIEEGGGEGANRWYRVTIAEGRYREVRKLFESVGLTVSRLIRIRYGCVVLPRGLQRGVWVELNENDVNAICKAAQVNPRPITENGGARRNHNKQPQSSQMQNRSQNRNNFSGGGGNKDRQRYEQPQRFAGQGNYSNSHKNGGGLGPNNNAPPQRRPYSDIDQQPGDPLHIPNPLEQTFDRRFVKGSQRIASGFGRPTEHPSGGDSAKKGHPRQPDPMQTSIGYIGADAFFHRNNGNKRRGGGGRGGFEK